MKKIALAAVAFTMVFTACKKNDDNSNNVSIVGKWNVTNLISSESENGGTPVFDTTAGGNGQYVEFTSDGKLYQSFYNGNNLEYDTTLYSVNGSQLYTSNPDGTHKDTAQILKLTDHELSVYGTYSISVNGTNYQYQDWTNLNR